jgi:glyoxylate reductase
MSTIPVVLLTRLPLPDFSAGEAAFAYVHYDGDDTTLEWASVIITTPYDPVDAAFIEKLPESITLIAGIGVGTDHIDVAAASARGILVTNTPVVTEDTADLAFALLLATSRRLFANESFLRNGQWSRATPIGALGMSVHGKTLGIVGFGAIGQAVARRARGFGMRILYHGPRPKPEAAKRLRATYSESLQELLERSDFVSLHCPLATDTRHLINTRRLAQMKSSGILINTGRGLLVNESELIQALAGGVIAAAGLDVFEDEPNVPAELMQLENVTMLPHIGTATAECRSDMVATCLDNIAAFINGDLASMSIVSP